MADEGVKAGKKPAPAYHIALGALAGLVGTGLFCGAVIWGAFGSNGNDPRASWVLTPLFAAPLAIYLMVTGRLRILGALAFVGLITVAHFAAICSAVAIYKVPFHSELGDLWSMVYDTPEQKAARSAAWSAKMDLARATAWQAGAYAGGVGAVLSFVALMPFGRAFRRLAALSAMLAAAAALAGIGAWAFSDRLPDVMAPDEFALRLFAPWQVVFGLLLAVLFAGHGKLTVTQPRGV